MRSETCPTYQYADELQKAFDFFNGRLFADELPRCLISLQRKRMTYGYFSPNRYQQRTGDERTHEIAMNPDGFVGRTEAEILSTLVHEMAHLWQTCFGKPGRNRYHNRQWADKMDELGLPPKCAKGTGKRTGDAVTHTIDPRGPFAAACSEWLANGNGVTWGSVGATRATTVKKPGSRAKYVCTQCESAAWGKPGLAVVCGDCMLPMETDPEHAGDEIKPADMLLRSWMRCSTDDRFDMVYALDTDDLDELYGVVQELIEGDE